MGFIITFIIVMLAFLATDEILHRKQVNNTRAQDRYPGFDSRHLDRWDYLVGALSAFAITLAMYFLFIIPNISAWVMYGIAFVGIGGYVMYHNRKSDEVERTRIHKEITIVLYETAFEGDAHGILDDWWQMDDGSIMMKLLPCDMEGNLDNSEPVHVSNATVKGWWYK